MGATMSLRILAVALGASFVAGFFGNMIMIPSGRDKLCMISSIVSAVVNLFLNILFIPKWGLNAAAATTAVSQILGFFFKLPFVEKEISLGDKKSLLAGPVIGSLLIFMITYFMRILVTNTIARVAAIVGVCVIVYGIILVIFKNDLALSVLGKLKKKVRRNE